MKAKRATRFLACVLSAAMCTMPVYASSATPVTGDGSVQGSLNTDFDLLKEKVEVTVPTKAEIRVNPLFDTGADTVDQYQIASKDLVVQNKSMDAKKENGIPVLVTAYGTVTAKGSDVQLYYDATKFTPSSTSTTKEVEIQLASENGSGTLSTDSTSSNGEYNLNTTANDSITNVNITTAGSRLQIPIAAPAVTNKVPTPTAGAFAVIGKANENAAWQKEDLTVTLYYNIQATKQSSVAAPTITIPTVVSGQAVSIDFADTDMGGAVPTKFVIHEEKDRLPETTMDTSTLGWTRDANDTKWTITIPANDEALKWYCQEQSSKSFDFLIALSDGRVVKTKITMP